MEMQAMLQQALAQRGGGGQPQAPQGAPMGDMGMGMSEPEAAPPTVQEVQEQLEAVLQEMESTEDPAQLEQLVEVAKQLQTVLEQMQAGTPEPYGSEQPSYEGY